jgi:putative oxidoreductase
MQNLQSLVALAARLLLAFIFVVDGWQAIGNYSGTAGYMESFGVPGGLLPLVILTELGGGLLVGVGLFARYAGFALSGFALLAALFFHRNFGDSDQAIHFMKDMAISGGFLLLTAFGPGAWSLDAWRRGRGSLP